MIYSDLSIIIPCKNESKNLEFIIPKLKEYSNEIIVVDANSNDGTKELCELHKITYLKDNNLGKGDAQRVGANFTSKKYIIFFDADGSHDENDIPAIYNKIKQDNIDLVICSRKTGGSYDLTANVSWSGFVRAAGCDFLSLLLNKIHNTELSDVLYSLKGVRKEKFLNLKTTENHFGIELDIILKSIKKKYQITEVPSREKKRVHGSSKLKTIVGIYFIYQIFRSKI
jgi:glycosyltransferase involved in cell wall biosynthesis